MRSSLIVFTAYCFLLFLLFLVAYFPDGYFFEDQYELGTSYLSAPLPLPVYRTTRTPLPLPVYRTTRTPLPLPGYRTTTRTTQTPLPVYRTTRTPLPLPVYRTTQASEPISERPINQSCPMVPKHLLQYVPLAHADPLTDREKILALCKQTEPIPLANFFTETMRGTIKVLGLGAFGETYGCQNEQWNRLAVKIVPIEGGKLYHTILDEQATFETILPEVVATIELSMLGDESRKNNMSILHYTKGFMQLKRVAVCTGKYPRFLLDAWDEYDSSKTTYNDRPDVFPEQQLYTVYSLESAGVLYSDHYYRSFEQFISIMRQISLTLAVGEAALQFEHRDMHRGNVLVKTTHKKYIYFRLDGVEYYIESHGVIATIIDYSYSRLTQEGTDCVLYNDMDKSPWLFRDPAEPNLQAQAYKTEHNLTQSNWKGFYQQTNIIWLYYLSVVSSMSQLLIDIDPTLWRDTVHLYTRPILVNNRGSKDVYWNVFSPDAVKRIYENSVSQIFGDNVTVTTDFVYINNLLKT